MDCPRAAIAADKALTFEMIETAGEEQLAGKMTAPPWAPEFKSNLGHHFLQMIMHPNSHKSQLFHYLKLQGKPVNTQTLRGMWGSGKRGFSREPRPAFDPIMIPDRRAF